MVASRVGFELCAPPPQLRLGSAQRVELLALGSHVEFRSAQPRAQCIALFELICQPVGHRSDSRADAVELGLGLGRFCGLVCAERAGTADQDPEDA